MPQGLARHEIDGFFFGQHSNACVTTNQGAIDKRKQKEMVLLHHLARQCTCIQTETAILK